MRYTLWMAGAAATLVALLFYSASPERSAAQAAERRKIIQLEPPRKKGDLSLEEALEKRRSVRQYASKTISQELIGQLFWAAQGITEPAGGYRTAPSAGALYPMEIYVATQTGVLHYLYKTHEMEIWDAGDLRNALYQAALEQEPVREASAVFIIAGIHERITKKYGERGIRYVWLEAGHVAQNILLQATVLNLGAVPIGAFRDDEVISALKLPKGEQPLYLIPVGYPTE